jgi:uncharacterized protein (TIGR02145 family)
MAAKCVATLDQGATLQLSADIVPKNASNQTLTWSIEGSEASLDEDLLLTAHAPGNVVIHVSTQDGSVKSDEWPLHINALGPASAKGASGEYYDVYCYPNLVGCWMIENSKEGTYTNDTYDATPYPAKGERCYYYLRSQARAKTDGQARSCPTGYHLPSFGEWSSLVAYPRSPLTTTDHVLKWTDSMTMAGSRNAAWGNWGARSEWWVDDSLARYYRYDAYEFAYIGGEGVISLSVRCVALN